MAQPLSPSQKATLNLATPPAGQRFRDYEVRVTSMTKLGPDENGNDEGKSSPLASAVKEDATAATATVTAPAAGRPASARSRPTSRILSGTELSPLKILQDLQPQTEETHSGPEATAAVAAAAAATMMPPPPPPPPSTTHRSPRKMSSPDKRFPVRISSPESQTTAAGAGAGVGAGAVTATVTARADIHHHHARHMSLEEALRQNEGLKRAVEIFEDVDDKDEEEEGSDEEGRGEEEKSGGRTTNNGEGGQNDRSEEEEDHNHKVAGLATAGPPVSVVVDPDDGCGADDTMMSAFSTFSAVPDMTMLARIQQPQKAGGGGGGGSGSGSLSPGKTPTSGYRAGPSPLSPSVRPAAAAAGGPLPNRTAQYEGGGGNNNTTNLLMDFTEQLRGFAQQQHQQMSPSSRRVGRGPGSPGKGGGSSSTPQRAAAVASLLDFDMPPLPTPRSIPSITARELESLKSGFLSDISSLKASLSGKEAEALALKRAVGDAEKRVGECLEQLREERGLREQLAAEKEGWERRGREMEKVLRQVKDEIVQGRRDRDELDAKLDEADKRREAAEMMAQEAESKMAGLRAGQAAAAAAGGSPGGASPSSSLTATQKEVERAVERVARELHAAYKSKHEAKVAALKKSYEARWEKRLRAAEARADDLADENERLRAGRNDATMSAVVMAAAAGEADERRAQAARDAAALKQLGAEAERLQAVARSVQADNADLRALLERERGEKGDLVLLAEELMAMQQQSFVAAAAPADAKRQQQQPQPQPQPQAHQAPPPHALLHQPDSSRKPQHGRASGLKPLGVRPPAHERKQSIPRPSSGIMSSIEKMGSHRGRGE